MATWRRALANVHRFVAVASTPTSRTSFSPLSMTHTQSPLTSQYGFLSLYSTTNGGSLEIDLSNEESKRRLFNRLLYRSKQRGFLELDLILGRWVEENIYSMDENGIRALVDVLDLENPDLWKWLIGQEQAPEAVSKNPVFSAVHDKITSNLNSHSAPETRAVPGRQWVRGWDDIKKGPGSPVAGNQ
ncbi:hypothetical protein K2173_027607 [Erythroxylum novogranatense]|uniref:Succinate dehydrogenase assembly factor 2, mitochondrial n=1 Tax=Erythroxylum novogranatense TaxID=1862640 RepID=A0AAV8U231_9ROSI|nr:hypothetical protein K2173_027607 [Erythroxylum novogranatense]